METKDINELITKLELEFDTKDSTTPRKHCTGWKLNLVADKYYYVNCKLRDILTSEEELREAYYQVYLKLFSVFLTRKIKRNKVRILVEISNLCWIVFHKDNFKIDNCCDRYGIFWVAKYNNDRYLSKYYTHFGDEIYKYPSEYQDEVLKEAVQIVYNMISEHFVEQIYEDKKVLECLKNYGYNRVVMHCLDYFPEGDMKDELYLECVL